MPQAVVGARTLGRSAGGDRGPAPGGGGAGLWATETDKPDDHQVGD